MDTLSSISPPLSVCVRMVFLVVVYAVLAMLSVGVSFSKIFDAHLPYNRHAPGTAEITVMLIGTILFIIFGTSKESVKIYKEVYHRLIGYISSPFQR